ncbi:MAG: hypothetical protein WC201_01625 [Bacilli bacterium]
MSYDMSQMLIVIAARKQKDKLIAELRDHHAFYINSMYGHGSLEGSKFANLFRFSSESEKVVISSFVRSSQVDEILTILEEKFHFNQVNTGFAFTIPIERLSH